MKPQNVICPLCDGPMTERIINRKIGQRFWRCNDFPNCKGTRDTDGLSQADRNRASDEPEREWKDS